MGMGNQPQMEAGRVPPKRPSPEGAIRRHPQLGRLEPPTWGTAGGHPRWGPPSTWAWAREGHPSMGRPAHIQEDRTHGGRRTPETRTVQKRVNRSKHPISLSLSLLLSFMHLSLYLFLEVCLKQKHTSSEDEVSFRRRCTGPSSIQG